MIEVQRLAAHSSLRSGIPDAACVLCPRGNFPSSFRAKMHPDLAAPEDVYVLKVPLAGTLGAVQRTAFCRKHFLELHLAVAEVEL